MSAPTSSPGASRQFEILLRAAVVAALTLLVVLATFWTVTGLIPILFTMFLPLVAWLALGAVAFWASVYALRHRRDGTSPWIPLVICFVGAALGLIVPFTDLWLAVNYHLHHAARMRVVTALEAGQLPTPRTLDSTIVLHLPWAAGASSGGGDILVERESGRLAVLFFTYRGILRHYSGYVWTSDDPPVLTAEFGDRIRQVRKVDPHWFFAAFY